FPGAVTLRAHTVFAVLIGLSSFATSTLLPPHAFAKSSVETSAAQSTSGVAAAAGSAGDGSTGFSAGAAGVGASAAGCAGAPAACSSFAPDAGSLFVSDFLEQPLKSKVQISNARMRRMLPAVRSAHGRIRAEDE